MSDEVTRPQPGSFEAERSTTLTRLGQPGNTHGSSSNPVVYSTAGRGRNPRLVGSIDLQSRADGDTAGTVRAGVDVRRPRSASPSLSSRTGVHAERGNRAWHSHRRSSGSSSERESVDGSEAARLSLEWNKSSGGTGHREESRNLESSGRGCKTHKRPPPTSGPNTSVADIAEKSDVVAESLAAPSGEEGDSGSGSGSGGAAAVFCAPPRSRTGQEYLDQVDSASTVVVAKGHGSAASISSVSSAPSSQSAGSFSPPTSLPPRIPTKGEGEGCATPSPVTSDAPRHESTLNIMTPLSSCRSEASSLQSFRPSQPGGGTPIAAAASPSSAAKPGEVSLISAVPSKSLPPPFRTVDSPSPTTTVVAESSARRLVTKDVAATQRRMPPYEDDGDASYAASPSSAKRRGLDREGTWRGGKAGDVQGQG